MLSLIFSLSLAFATEADVTTDFSSAKKLMGKSQVNWTEMRIEAKNAYASRQESWELKENWASKAVGEKIKESVLHLRIDSENTLGSLIEAGGLNSKSLNSGVDEWQTVETRYIQSTDEVEVVGHLNLNQYLRQIRIERSSSDIGEMTAELHTSILIDARGTDLNPVVFPVIKTPSGETVLSISGFSRKVSQTMNFALYVNDPAHPKAASMMGANPAIIRAGRADNGDLIVLKSDIQHLPSAKDLAAINAMGLIIIVVD